LRRGATIPQVCKKLQISPATFHRWRKRLGGSEQTAPSDGNGTAKLKRLERENKRLKILVAELTLENAFLKDALEDRTAG
jgi:putative transposase